MNEEDTMMMERILSIEKMHRFFPHNKKHII